MHGPRAAAVHLAGAGDAALGHGAPELAPCRGVGEPTPDGARDHAAYSALHAALDRAGGALECAGPHRATQELG